jgi:chitin synthase
MFHQINNIIGVDPELYEYLFMVDADTKVKEDSLNRLVAACANDATIAGICGETSLENEEGSWWTMIQVYEYYISHNLAKAFESLFGSVTCLPGWYVLGPSSLMGIADIAAVSPCTACVPRTKVVL